MKSPVLLRCAVLSASMLAMLGCGKKDEATLLSHVPADTAFVVAATEPPPKAVVDAWLKRAQPLWPAYDTMLARLGETVDAKATAGVDAAVDNDADGDAAEAAGDDAMADTTERVGATANAAVPAFVNSSLRISRELIKDLRSRDSADKMAETGLAVPGVSAFYAVGAMPVARLQLASADAFKAWVAKIENASGSQFSTAKLGTLDYWFVPGDKLQVVMAIQDSQLVVTAFPAKADEALRLRLLGVTKPEKSLADSGELTTLMKAEGFSPMAAGWFDLRRMFSLYPADASLVALNASLGDGSLPALTAECRSEIESIIAKAPRLIGGYTEITATRMAGRARWELAPAVAAELLPLAPAPVAAGGSHPDSLFDMSFGMPVLKAKDYALKQAKAIVAAPYRCESLKGLNEMATKSIEKLSQMLPPPFSDITGFRITLDSLVMPTGELMVPDVRGKLLVASENPSFMIGLAQMAVPALASLVIKPDGQPVELPTKDLPMGADLPPIHVAMADKALAVSFGKDEAASLAAYVKAPAGKAGDWITSSYSGDIYKLQGEFMAKMQELAPDQQKQSLDAASMAELYRFYAATFKRLDGNLRLSAKGIEFDNSVELKP